MQAIVLAIHWVEWLHRQDKTVRGKCDVFIDGFLAHLVDRPNEAQPLKHSILGVLTFLCPGPPFVATGKQMLTNGRTTDLHLELLEDVCLKDGRSADRGSAFREEASHNECTNLFGQLPREAATLVVVARDTAFLCVELAVDAANHAFRGRLALQVADL